LGKFHASFERFYGAARCVLVTGVAGAWLSQIDWQSDADDMQSVSAELQSLAEVFVIGNGRFAISGC
jgi:hypothetical protein